MKKNIVLILATDGFEDSELIVVRDLLIRKGFDVDVAFDSKKDYVTSSFNLKIKVEKRLDNVLRFLDSYVALYIPGGMSVEKLDQNPLIYKIIREFHEKNKVIGALSAAPLLLANANVLEDKKVICYPDKKIQATILRANGILVSTNCKTNDECAVISDKKIVTGLNMEVSFRFANQFLKAIID